jgi:hypothetical protein
MKLVSLRAGEKVIGGVWQERSQEDIWMGQR